MIATVTLNPAIDIRYSLRTFQIGEVNRVSSIEKTVGGKGLNVSRVLSQLGTEVTCTGFLGGNGGEWIAVQLPHCNLINRFVSIKSETRSCLAILAEDEQTEILEHGPTIYENEIEAFIITYETILESADYIVVSGSLPEGIATDFYQLLAQKAARKEKYLLLDTSGPALESGIRGKPFLIKPNKEEFERLVGGKLDSIEEMIMHAQAICREGVGYVLLSRGQEGALLISQTDILKAIIPPIKVRNAVGSGDSMLAGFTYAHSKGFPIDKVLKWACACGMSNAAQERTGHIDFPQVEHFFSSINVTELRAGDTV